MSILPEMMETIGSTWKRNLSTYPECFFSLSLVYLFLFLSVSRFLSLLVFASPPHILPRFTCFDFLSFLSFVLSFFLSLSLSLSHFPLFCPWFSFSPQSLMSPCSLFLKPSLFSISLLPCLSVSSSLKPYYVFSAVAEFRQ